MKDGRKKKKDPSALVSLYKLLPLEKFTLSQMLKRNLLSRQVARQDCRIFTYLAVGYCAHLRTPAVNYPKTSKNRVLSWRNERSPPTWLIESVHLHTTAVPVSYQSRRLKKKSILPQPQRAGTYLQDRGRGPVVTAVPLFPADGNLAGSLH